MGSDKDAWLGKERLRWATLFHVPMAESMPPGFPQNTLQAQRALVAVSLIRPQHLGDSIAALYDRSFVKVQDIHTLESIRPVFVEMFGDSATEEIMNKVSFLALTPRPHYS